MHFGPGHYSLLVSDVAGAGVAGRGRASAARRRGGAHLPRAGAGHQAVPGGAERGGRAAARQRGRRVRGQLRRAGGDHLVPPAGRRRGDGRGGGGGRRAAGAPGQPHGRAAVSDAPRLAPPPPYPTAPRTSHRRVLTVTIDS